MAEFKRSLAVVIGINEYQDYPKLQTARYDAERLAEILAIDHKYDYVILAADDTYKEYLKGQELPVKNKYQPTLNGLLNLLSKRLPAEIKPTQEDRLVFYFAGHGIPDDSDEGPKGYLVPLDGDSKKRDSLLPMQQLYKSLEVLNCRHFIVILDCCFAGRFRYWSTTRKGRTFPRVIHKEHYDRFINSPAWQAITSASHDQEAFDILCDNRGTVEGTNHSPFAEGLFKALRGEADVIPAGKNGKPAGDGVITATELYLYLRDHVEIGSKERQTPGLWSLPKHDRGEFIFLVPGVNSQLKPAPKVNEKNNPYRGLESFEEEYAQFFFGRKELIEQLYAQVSGSNQQSSQLTVVLGVSGSGKSSLVKAGLIPLLRKEHTTQWQILKPMRPGESPFTALARTLLELTDITLSNQLDTLNFISEVLKEKIDDLDARLAESLVANGEESSETLRFKKEVENVISIAKDWNQGNQKARQLLIVEHFEELYALCRNLEEQQQLKQVVSDCLNPLSQRLQEPNQFIDIVRAWSQKNPGVKLLVAIDQFEELITLSRNIQEGKQNNQQQQSKTVTKQPTQKVQQQTPEWKQFLSLLENTLNANLEQLRIVVTLRSDFEPRFLNSDALKSYWTKARFPVRAMRSDELRQAIEGPASEMALYFEPPNLVDKLIDEVGQMPGALPLLSFTLSELYIKLAQKWRIQETSDRALRIDADFDTEGGVAGSLTRRANQEYDGLPDDAHRATLRRVMLRMVTTEGGESARRRVPLSEFVYAEKAENDRVKLVLEQFNHARLIVSGQETGEPYVEPAHDFLVRSWDKLQKWQQEEQEDLPLQRRLTPVALEWKSKEHSSSLLGKTEPFLDWCDKKIDSAEDWLNQIKKDAQERRREKKRQFLWNGNPYLDVLRKRLKSYDHWFNEVETEFVQQSVWQRRRNTNLRWSIASAVILFLSGLTIWALREQRNAVIGQMRTARESSEAGLRTNNLTLDTLIQSLQAGKPSKHLLLQVVPPDKQLQNQVIDTLRKAVYLNREQQRWQLPQSDVAQDTFMSKDGKLLIATTTNKGTICVWDLESRQCGKVPANLGSGINAKFSPDGKKLALMSENFSGVYLWDWTNNQFYQSSKLPGRVESVSFSPNSKALALISHDQNGQGSAYWWNLKNKQFSKLTTVKGNIQGIGFKTDGNLLVATTTHKNNNNTVYLWDYRLRKNLGVFKPEFPFSVDNVIISPNGSSLVIIAGSARAAGAVSQLWNVGDKQPQALGQALKLNFSPDGEQLAIRDSNGTVRLLKSPFGSQVAEFKGHQGLVSSISFSPNGNQFFTVGNDNTIRLWNVAEEIQLLSQSQSQELQNSVQQLSFSSDGKQLATLELATPEVGTVHLYDFSSGQHLKKLPQSYNAESQLIFSPKDKQLAIVEPNVIHLWDLSSNKAIDSFPGQYEPQSSLSFSPDGKKLAIIESNEEQSTLRLLDLATKQEKKSNWDTSFIKSISWKSDANGDKLLVAIAGVGTRASVGSVEIWDFFSRKQLASLELTQRFIKGIKNISLNHESSLVTINLGNSIILWDLQSGQSVKFNLGSSETSTDGDTNSAKFSEISPDGSVMATIDENGKAKLWQLGGFDDLFAKGCTRVYKYLNTLDEKNSARHLCDGISNSPRK
ncbi:MAG TPA: caspase family protein [Coleofasciculaceae cyanobacterium]|jgi:WD40 repeat protein